MTEEEYQADIKQLWTEMQVKADNAVDFIVMQPPIRQARHELYRLLEWALIAGAEQPDLVQERMRRRKLGKGVMTDID